jgi:hypothetical protein
MIIIALLIKFGVLNLPYWWALLPLGIYLLVVGYILIGIWINSRSLNK